MSKRVCAVIPARLGSRRFSGKVLFPYRGKPLLFYVWDAVRRARRIDEVVIATSDKEIMNAAQNFGATVVRTSAKHQTGSDRASEVLKRFGGDIIVNVQADNLGLKPAVLDKVVTAMKRERSIVCATLARRITSDQELHDPNCTKVVTDGDGRALWFSRSVIPHLQRPDNRTAVGQFPYMVHIGVYFYRSEVLRAYGTWKRTPLERAESLEQLRLLEHGTAIRVFSTNMRSVSIDAPRDVKQLDALYR